MENYKQRFRPKVVATHSSPTVVYPQGRASCSDPQRPSPFVRDDGAAQRAASSDCVRPVLASKFSFDNLTSKRINTKAWLQNIAAASTALSTSSSSHISSSKTGQQYKPLNISNPEVVYQGATIYNTALGMGAKRIATATDAFSESHVYRGPASPTVVRRSEDSVRSEISLASSTSSFGNDVRERALPQLPLRIDSLQRAREAFGDSVEQLAHPSTSPSPKTANLQQATPAPSASQAKQQSIPSAPAIAVTPFKAILTRSASWSTEVDDESKLISLRVGSQTFSTTLATISKKPSHLRDFVEQAIAESSVTLKGPSPSNSSIKSAYSQASIHEPQLSSKQEPAQVLLHLPSSPISALRSSRASIFDGVPSDEGEDREEWEKHASGLRVPAVYRLTRSCSSSSINTSLNFIDTTPDEEVNDPFHFARRNVNTPSQPPSLSSSPNSSAFGGRDSPLFFATQLSAARPFDRIAGQGDVTPLEIHLDRDPASYQAILYYLREGELPRKLCYATSLAVCSGKTGEDDAESSLKTLLRSVPLASRPALLSLALHDTISQLQDIASEAAFLGILDLQGRCQKELKMIESAISSSAVESLNSQRVKDGRQSPLKKRVGVVGGRQRPALTGHRQFQSEGDIPKVPVLDKNGWI